MANGSRGLISSVFYIGDLCNEERKKNATKFVLFAWVKGIQGYCFWWHLHFYWIFFFGNFSSYVIVSRHINQTFRVEMIKEEKQFLFIPMK